MNYTQKNFMKVFKSYTFKELWIDFAIALLTIATFPFMIFCLIIRPIIYREIHNATSLNRNLTEKSADFSQTSAKKRKIR